MLFCRLIYVFLKIFDVSLLPNEHHQNYLEILIGQSILLWNNEIDKRYIVIELYQFLKIYYWLVRIFNSSDDVLLVRAKRQKF